MNKKALIIGFGSIGRQHYKVLKKLKIFNRIYICSKHYKNVNCFSNINDILKINPDLIIICSETSKHLNQLKFFESNFKNKKIIIEKPIFSKSCLLKIKNNQVFVGYNLRYDPMLQYLKKKFKHKKILFQQILFVIHICLVGELKIIRKLIVQTNIEVVGCIWIYHMK